VTTSTPDSIAVEVIGKIIGYAVALPVVAAFTAALIFGALFYETWVAMTLWNWFAPWTLPFSLIAGVGMNMAASIIFRNSTRAKDERTTTERLTAIAEHCFGVPTTALVVGWLLHWYTR
jgi:hypothetical protein